MAAVGAQKNFELQVIGRWVIQDHEMAASLERSKITGEDFTRVTSRTHAIFHQSHLFF
jgi:hypothetical protein